MSDARPKFILNSDPAECELYPPPSALTTTALVPGLPAYHRLYQESIVDTDGFWKKVASNFHFEKGSDKGLEYNFDHRKGDIFVRFMDGAKTNIAYNCLDRHVNRGLGSKIAFYWEGNEPGDEMSITYSELLKRVSNMSALLRSKGVQKGDVVAIYLPMILELAIAMLATARIGAVHSVVFAGFSADSLATRIIHGKSRVLITADGCYRGSKPINLKMIADHAIQICHENSHSVDRVFVVEHSKTVKIPNGSQRIESKYDQKIDFIWDGGISEPTVSAANVHGGAASCSSDVEWVESEDPLFVLYTSGSTGTPKGLIHTTSGYMCYTYLTCKLSFDIHPETDVFWTTADCGWITGHSYVVYGPLLNGLTSVMFEGVPNYPDPSRFWAVIEKYKITKFYTAPTAIRALMAFSDNLVKKHDLSTLKVIGTVGEPINPSAWRWLYNMVGEKRCAVVDTYWQTETGGHVLTPLPGAVATKPGSATLPFPGITPTILDSNSCVIEGPGSGSLCFSRAWPGMMRTILGDEALFRTTYFTPYPGFYFTGDGGRRDDDGYYWITGRVDDMMNVSGHLLSTSEIESALVSHPLVVEAAVVAAPHAVKGQFPYAFVTLSDGRRLNQELVNELKNQVREKIGAIAIPDIIQEAPGLPKTRSGKITRRILRKIAEGDASADLGDTTTLIDESVVGQLWKCRDLTVNSLTNGTLVNGVERGQ